MTIKAPLAKNAERETEELLGPLPDRWTKAKTDSGRALFIDHNTKTTHWIDPRTKKTRKTDITQIKDGELPYGWEELFDQTFGYYYADHNTQTNYGQPPWTKETRENAVKKREEMLNEAKKVAMMAMSEMQKRGQGKEGGKEGASQDEMEFQTSLKDWQDRLASIKEKEKNLKMSNADFKLQTHAEKYEILLERQNYQRRAIEEHLHVLRQQVTPQSPTSPSRLASLFEEMKLKQKSKTSTIKLQKVIQPDEPSAEDLKDAETARAEEDKKRADEEKALQQLKSDEQSASDEYNLALKHVDAHNNANETNPPQSLKDALESASAKLQSLKQSRQTKENQIQVARAIREKDMLAELARKKQERAEAILRKIDDDKRQKLEGKKDGEMSPFALEAERKRLATAEAMKKKEEEAGHEKSKNIEESDIEKRRQQLKQKEAERQEKVKAIIELKKKLEEENLKAERAEKTDYQSIMENELETLALKKMIQSEQRALKKMRRMTKSKGSKPAQPPSTPPTKSTVTPRITKASKASVGTNDRQTFMEKMEVVVADDSLDEALQNVMQ